VGGGEPEETVSSQGLTYLGSEGTTSPLSSRSRQTSERPWKLFEGVPIGKVKEKALKRPR